MLKEIQAYIESLRNRELRPRTLCHYEFVLRSLNTFLAASNGTESGDVPVTDVSIAMLNEYGSKQRMDGLSPNARNNYSTIIRSFFNFLYSAHLIDKNPSVALQYIKPGKLSYREGMDDDAGEGGVPAAKYTLSDIQTLFESLANCTQTQNVIRDRAILALFLASSLRAFEVCSLLISDISGIQSGTVRCIKKGSDRKSPATVGAFCVPYIMRYLELRGHCEPDEPLFASQKRNPATGKPNPLTPNALWKSFATKQRGANTKTGLHCFRTASLTEVTRSGGIAAARDFGRHRKAKVTADYYAKSTAAERREAIETSQIAHIFEPDESRTLTSK